MQRLLITAVAVASSMVAGCFSMAGGGGAASAEDMQKKAQPAKVNWAPVEFAEAEAVAPALVKQWLPSQGSPPPTAVRLYFETNDWQMNRSPEGTILNRYVNILLFTKGGQHPDWCWARAGSIQEGEHGGSWGKPQLILPQEYGYIMAVTCPTVDALRPGAPL